jgi:uncharacterized damage-inducible protein DinB
MNEPGITLKELLAYNEQESEKWKRYFATNPTALDVHCDIYNSGNVRGLLRHIFAVELRHSQRLLGEEVTPYEAISPSSDDELFALHTTALENLRKFLSTAESGNLEEEIALQTVSAGTLNASRRKLFAHILLHSIRHWAQLTVLLRQNGFTTHWPKDLLFSYAIR